MQFVIMSTLDAGGLFAECGHRIDEPNPYRLGALRRLGLL